MNTFSYLYKSTTILFAFSLLACEQSTESSKEPDNLYLGGEGTIFDNTGKAYSLPLRNLAIANSQDFFVGNSLFNKNWVSAPATATVRDGLGPFFNTTSCSACHFRDGRGRPPEEGEELVGLLFRLSIPGNGEHGGPLGDPIYGGQLSPKALTGLTSEGDVEITYETLSGTYLDGEAYSLQKPKYKILGNYGELTNGYMISPRVAQGVYGLGLIEAISEADILRNEDKNDSDQDSISGKANYVWNIEKKQKELGRFGWKANQPSLKQQTAGAFLGDMGITTSMFPNENHNISELDTLPNGNHSDTEYELIDTDLKKVVLYIQTLAVPARRDFNLDNVKDGQNTFSKINCTKCHTPSFTTGSHEVAELSNQTIFPYSDFLLHDMGDDLADNRPDFLADGHEWRTPPLWGLGLQEKVNGHTRLLHDGRARNFEEAILWHGGEALNSKNEFTRLPKEERQNLISFLESL